METLTSLEHPGEAVLSCPVLTVLLENAEEAPSCLLPLAGMFLAGLVGLRQPLSRLWSKGPILASYYNKFIEGK